MYDENDDATTLYSVRDKIAYKHRVNQAPDRRRRRAMTSPDDKTTRINIIIEATTHNWKTHRILSERLRRVC